VYIINLSLLLVEGDSVNDQCGIRKGKRGNGKKGKRRLGKGAKWRKGKTGKRMKNTLSTHFAFDPFRLFPFS